MSSLHVKAFQNYSHFVISHFPSPSAVQPSSLSQPVMSQADNNEPLQGLYIGLVREQMIRFKVLDLHTFISFVLGKSQDS